MNLTLYIDVTNKRFITGPNDSTPFNMPPLFQGAKVNLKVYLFEANPAGGLTTPFTAVTTTGSVLRVAVGNPAGQSAPVAMQDTFTVGGPTYFTGALSLNTVQVDALLSDQASVQTWLEIDFAPAGDIPEKIIQTAITLKASLMGAPGTQTAPNETPLPSILMADGSGNRFLLTIVDGQLAVSPIS